MSLQTSQLIVEHLRATGLKTGGTMTGADNGGV